MWINSPLNSEIYRSSGKCLQLFTYLYLYHLYLYHTIQEELPRDSSFKLIDLWLLHGLVMPMIVFVTLAANELMKTKTTEDTKLKKITKVGNHGSATTYIKKGGTMKTSQYSRSTCMLICKTIIPTSSLIFIIGFFFVCWIHGRH